MSFLLGLDNGGTVTKAAIFDYKGSEIAVSTQKTEMLFPQFGYTERNIEELWQANARAVRAVLEKSGINPGEIVGLSVTGYGNGMILIDEKGEPVCDGIVSTDTRANKIVENWYQDGTFEKVFPLTCQSIWAAQPVALLAWFKKNKPGILKKSRWLLMCKDYIRYRLTNEVWGELSDYSGTSTMDINKAVYDRSVLELFGIDEYMCLLPPIKGATDLCGTISKEAASLTGLAEGTPVAGGLFDIHACCLATGVTTTDTLSCIAGTWTINEYLSDEPLLKKDIFMNSLFPIDNLYLVMEGSATSASNLEWFLNTILIEKKNSIELNGSNIYEYCNGLVDSIKPDESEIIFLPYLFSSNVGSKYKACFLGLNGWHTRAHLIRSIYEGVVFSAMLHIEKLLDGYSGIKKVRLAGGPARAATWVQMYADCLQLPVEVSSVNEIGALGAAMCASVVAGVHRNLKEAAEKMSTVSAIYEPDYKATQSYREKFNRFKSAISSLKEYW